MYLLMRPRITSGSNITLAEKVTPQLTQIVPTIRSPILTILYRKKDRFWILGYSQGAAFIPVYLANTSNTFDIAVMSNGYLPTTHQGLMSTINSVAPFRLHH